jgi:hypothetical protein
MSVLWVILMPESAACRTILLLMIFFKMNDIYNESLYSEMFVRNTIFDRYNIPFKRIVKDSTVNNYGHTLIDCSRNNEIL